MKKVRGPNGGARPGAGRKAGGQDQTDHAIAKRANRERIRQLVERDLDPLIAAQKANALGVSYMILRHPDGTFARATDVAQIDAACAAGATSFQIFTQQPHQPSAAMLLGYAADKPVEPVEVTGKDGESLTVVLQAAKARLAHAQRG